MISARRVRESPADASPDASRERQAGGRGEYHEYGIPEHGQPRTCSRIPLQWDHVCLNGAKIVQG